MCGAGCRAGRLRSAACGLCNAGSYAWKSPGSPLARLHIMMPRIRWNGAHSIAHNAPRSAVRITEPCATSSAVRLRPDPKHRRRGRRKLAGVDQCVKASLHSDKPRGRSNAEEHRQSLLER